MHRLLDSTAARTAALLLSLGLVAPCHARQAAPAKQPEAAAEEMQEVPNLPEPDPGLEADLEILRRLERAFDEPPTFEDAPVSEVLERVAKETGLRVLPDRHVLSDGGGWKLKSVTCTPKTPRAALDAAVRSLGEGLDSVRLDVASGVLVFTDTDGLRALRAKRIYRIGDLLRALTTVTGGAQGEPMQLLGDEVFADLLYQSVIPDDWTANGGDLAHESIVGELLIVTATPATHLLVERTLEEFRAAVPIEPVLWTITLRTLPNDLDPAIERRLIAAGAEEYDRKSDLPGEVVSRPSILAQPTEPASIEIGNDSDRWRIEIAPDCDAGRCTYAIVAEHTAGDGDTKRTSRAMLHSAVGAPAATVFTIGEGAAARRFLLHAIGNRQALAKRIAPKQP
ncbi:MAG: hypothetical protein LW806_04445 [Planctomycetaceae bacterium]|nr:hypothetical protein [Planctomycetaceae bacterium]